ncbi:attractin-like [Neocloeon triangulifer]|uniref:attractin-like n=1 Tax=Neocloeon triangulifer TaxID=2078957 RepID=UPI00286F3DDE|nr:attractin-like [Neocloeon triangulifer]
MARTEVWWAVGCVLAMALAAVDGLQGGGKCSPQCVNGYCHPETSKCVCTTKGIIGDQCDKCDTINHYSGDPTNGSCFYDLTIDYQFTFNLSRKEDRHYSQINFKIIPPKPDVDTNFQITCSVPSKMKITVRTANGPEKDVLVAQNCSNFRHRFSKSEYQFGLEDNATQTTFYVYLYGFQPLMWIQIGFAQYTPESRFSSANFLNYILGKLNDNF